MKNLADKRLKIGDAEYKPLLIGAMGVDISTKELALAAADFGAIGHISDAMITVVTDRRLKTDFVSRKLAKNRIYLSSKDKSEVRFDIEDVREATRLYAKNVMKDKTGVGAIFANCMEKLTMNDEKRTLDARLNGLLDGGIDGITLSAGLHMGSFALMENHPRFRVAKLGIIVSSARALRIFLLKSKKTNRLPDYVIVEGPLAGGHLGFSLSEIQTSSLEERLAEVLSFLQQEGLDIPVIAAGGIFTGRDAVKIIESGASAIQVATRFTIAKESGLPDAAKQAYLKAREEDIVVRNVSPTGYPMRLLRQSPALKRQNRPRCEAYGFLLSNNGTCAYLKAYQEAQEKNATCLPPNAPICLCTAMRNFHCWTCGATTHRLKETVKLLPNGDYALPTAKEIMEEYLIDTEEQYASFPMVEEQFLEFLCVPRRTHAEWVAL